MKASPRRLLAAVFAAVLALGVFSLPARAADAQPGGGQLPAGQYAAAPSDGQDGAALADANRATSLRLAAGAEVSITSSAPFDSLYLVWDAPPGAHELAAGGETVPDNGYGFIHEYIELSAPATEAVLRLAEGEYILCDVYLFSGGELPDFVQVWQPPCERADLLLLPTHADDEHLFFGGAMPTYAGGRGLAVQVAYMTHHWGEAYRPHELLNGLWEVGVTHYPVIGPFQDLFASKESLADAEQTYGRDEVLAFQVELLRRFKPRVVVAHDINGEYGHGAHMLNAATLLDALPLAPSEEAFPESAAQYGAYEVPKAYLHLWPENQITMDWNVPLEHFGGKTGFEKAQDGFAKHVSQTEYFSVEQSGPYDCRLFGLAHTTVGPDAAGNDFFENIDLSPEPAPEPEPEPEPAVPEEVEPPPIGISAEPEKAFPWYAVVILAAVAAVAAAVVVVAVRRSRRRRRRKKAAGRDGRVYYRKR